MLAVTQDTRFSEYIFPPQVTWTFRLCHLKRWIYLRVWKTCIRSLSTPARSIQRSLLFTDTTALVGNGNALVPVFIALVMTQHSYNHLPENLKNHYFIARHGFSLANNAKLICSNPEIAIPEIGGPLNTGWGLHERGKEQVKKVQLC